ncbi:ribosome-associated heat shock protein Hsp15 [Celerinatantimonas sp. YJH-8]|uniref:ribosome-associated heat shock protein Hsp15 n=1 Tax=Celerinatantimonas sp. YJH-8 TaxID=3228714 RepID=UPI0038C3B50D
MTQQSNVRLDKWLWAARFFKTRALAREMIAGGKVHYNQQRCKPSKIVEAGALISLWQGNVPREVLVVQLSDKRGSAPVAQTLYQETDASLAKRTLMAEQQRLQPKPLAPERRPDKKQRRQILQFKHQRSGD